MTAVEFITELSPERMLRIPESAAAQLPVGGKARVIILTENDPEDAEWRRGAYEQFMRDDGPKDSVYDKYSR
jgi:hypothetical protein